MKFPCEFAEVEIVVKHQTLCDGRRYENQQKYATVSPKKFQKYIFLK